MRSSMSAGRAPSSTAVDVRFGAPRRKPVAADPDVAARRLVHDEPHWSDRAISAATGLNARAVAAIRAEVRPADHHAVRLGLDGRLRPLSGEKGRRLAGEFVRAHPDASLRAIAEAAGISVGTARDVRDRVRRGEDPVLPRRGPARAGARAARQEEPLTGGDVATLVSTLAGDPSLRYLSAGRMLLRMIALHMADDGRWADVTDAIPLHCVPAVAQAARACAQVWLDLVERLEDAAR